MRIAPLCAAVLVAATTGCVLDREGRSSVESGGGATAAGGSGGAGASAGAGGAVGVGGGGSGGMPGTEDCLDGIDNDANGLVDCEDPGCQPGYECVPEVLAGWTGHRIESTAYPSATVQACADGSAPTTRTSTPGGPATCAACTCSAPMGASCSFPTLGAYANNTNCGGGANATFDPDDAACHDFPGSVTCSCQDNHSADLLTDSQVQGTATCAPSGGTATLPEPWEDQHNMCALGPAGGGCAAGSECVARAAAPYDQGLCVFQDGDHACPAAFPNLIQSYSITDDTRGCTACACGTPSVQCSGGSFTLYDPDGCAAGGENPLIVSGSSCVRIEDYLDNETGSYRATAGMLSGSCSASGGAATGTVTGNDPGTLCCE